LDNTSANANIPYALKQVPYNGGITNTDQALHLVRTDMLTALNGDRPNNKNVVVVISDGRSNNKQATLIEANKLHNVSDDVVSIIVGSGTSNNYWS